MARKHESVRGYLLAAMRDELAPNDRLPSEREIADRLGVSRPTVRRALDQLAAEGRVHRVQGSGTFVAEPPPPDDEPVWHVIVVRAERSVIATLLDALAQREPPGAGAAGPRRHEGRRPTASRP